ncbi:unnamed protein product, partial [Symbiodinium sp. CCMP2456]
AFSSCTACTTIDAADWIFCLDTHGQVETKRLRKAKDKFAKETLELDPSRLETLTMDLFKAHDLNGDGFLQEMELITLNERIAMLHHGKGAFELQEVRDTYSRLFRTKLDPQGRPVPFEIFRRLAVGFRIPGISLLGDMRDEQFQVPGLLHVWVAFSGCSGCGCFLSAVLGAFAARCAGRVFFNEASELVGEC